MSIRCLVWLGRLLERRNDKNLYKQLKLSFTIEAEEQSKNCPRPPDESLQGVVSSHSQVEARVTDMSLHPMNRLPRSSTQQVGVEKPDDV